MKEKIKELFERHLSSWHNMNIFSACIVAFTQYPSAQLEEIADAYAEVALDYDAMIQEAVDSRR